MKFILSLSCSSIRSCYSPDFSSAKFSAIPASVVEITQTTTSSQQLSRGPGHQKMLSRTCTGLSHPSFVYRILLILTLILRFFMSGPHFIAENIFVSIISFQHLAESVVFVLCFQVPCSYQIHSHKAQESWLPVGLKSGVEDNRDILNSF